MSNAEYRYADVIMLSVVTLGVIMLSVVILIRKDCFQVKSNLLTVDNLVFHFELQFLIKLK